MSRSVPAVRRLWFEVRYRLGQRLQELGIWITPEYRSRHRYTDDGQSVVFWVEPR